MVLYVLPVRVQEQMDIERETDGWMKLYSTKVRMPVCYETTLPNFFFRKVPMVVQDTSEPIFFLRFVLPGSSHVLLCHL